MSAPSQDPIKKPANGSSVRSWPDLAPRIAVAAVLLPVTAMALFLGWIWFALLVGVAYVGVYREWEAMIAGGKVGMGANILAVFVGFTPIAFVLGGIWVAAGVSVAGIVVGLFISGAPKIWRLGGQVFFGLVMLALLAIRGDDSAGIFAALFLAVAVWMTDTSAFFAGRQIGGAKLSPDISPSKTWSGAIGGLAAGALGALIVWVFASGSPWWIGLGLGALLSVLGQAGDLVESAVKRHFHLKDSGDILPGHGGLMDRLDSLTFAAIAVFLIGMVRLDVDNVALGFLIW